MVEVKFTNFCDPLATRSSAGTSDSDEEKSQTKLALLTHIKSKPAALPPLQHGPASPKGNARVAAEQEAQDAH